MREENISLHDEKNNLSKENVFLKKRVNELEEAIKHKKDSNNSSIPPSKDENNYFIELEKNLWVNEFKQILLRAFELKHEFLNNIIGKKSNH